MSNWCLHAAIGLLGVTLLSAPSARVFQDPAKPANTKPREFPPSDPEHDIAAALAAAKRDGKFVLLDFGADWCVDCVVLQAAFRDAAVKPFVDAHFHVVTIDVGEFLLDDRKLIHGDVARRYGADVLEEGVPVLVLLDAEGRIVPVPSHINWVVARRFSVTEVLRYLRASLPPATDTIVRSMTENGVRVDVKVQRDAAGGTWLAATFTPTAPGFQLYGSKLDPNGLDGVGRPTRLVLPSDQQVRQVGEVLESVLAKPERVEILHQTFPMYPAGPVTLRVEIDRSQATDSSQTEVLVTYMACGPTGCLSPVENKRIGFTLKKSDD